ncbi:MAG: hypothetical protein HZB26_09305 [Candidatus Hydrogenedentes bacterium]|nr:hypothetical protein [Candidatus Hydrogenedentota bacterium]
MSTVLMGALIGVGAAVLLALAFWMYVSHLGRREKIRLKEMRTRFLTGEMEKHH